jgi:beta-lactam-binding protein with PASTA domain
MTIEQYRASKQGDNNRNGRGRLLLIGVIVATLLVAILGWYIGIGRYVDTPQLVGQTEAQAVNDAKRAGFTFTVKDRAFSETAPLGTVIKTDPGPGDRILPGSTIEGVISQGKERYAIPDIKGDTLDEATMELAKLHLKVGETTTAYDEHVDKGDVVRATDFAVGAQVKRNAVIDLVVSKGRKPIEIVDYTGKSGSDAQKALEKAGFKVNVERAYSDDVDSGKVISQSPKDGKGFKDDTITLTVSRGPAAIDVPNVIGKTKSQAVQILEDAGFKVRAFGPGNFTVQAQTPRSDKKARKGSSVTIAGL